MQSNVLLLILKEPQVFGSLLRSILAWIDRTKARFLTKKQPLPVSSNQRVVEQCRAATTLVQERLHLKYSPLEARLQFIRTTHPNILEMTKFLKQINKELGVKKPHLLQSEFPYNQTDTPLDSFFVSSSGNYISQNAIKDLVEETFTMLGYASVLAQAEVGTEEYHFRMLSRTLSSLTSIHGAISTVLAE